MKQLELRVYSKQEISEILSVNPDDSNHYKRNVENKLFKWGYRWKYTPSEVTITHAPTTSRERLQEILIRRLDLSIQVDPFQFACFLSAFQDIEGFHSMPWEERAKAFNERYGFSVCDRTLRNWASKLLRKEIMAKVDEKTFWKTEIDARGVKIRTIIAKDDSGMKRYNFRKNELLSQFREDYILDGHSLGMAEKLAWKEAMKELGYEFHCWYYSCKSFMFGAFENDEEPFFQEVWELTNDLLNGQ